MNTVNLISKTPERYEMREAFRTLRTNILFSGSDIKTIAITSCTQNEGKSFVSLELAKSLADAGKKVLLLDTDLRKSVIAEKYVEDTELLGLSHFLSGQAEIDDVMYATQFEKLSIIFAGPYPPNPVELLGSSRFFEVLLHLRDVFDYIIVDTPPLGLVIDAAVVAAACDGVIINVAARKVNYRMVKNIKSQLERSNCHIIGTVLNKVDSSEVHGTGRFMGYGKIYGKSYGYTYEDGAYGSSPSGQSHYTSLDKKEQ